MDTKPESDTPKNKNITILVTTELRERIDALRKAHFSGLQINQFTKYLVELGLEEETRFEERAALKEARLKKASVPETTRHPNAGITQYFPPTGEIPTNERRVDTSKKAT